MAFHLKKKKNSTLVGICLSRLLVYMLAVLIVYEIIIAITGKMWKYTFPEIDDYLSYTSLLTKDEYNRIPKKQFSKCNIIIYGEKGSVVYASDEDVRISVSADELNYIPGIDDDYSYSVMEGEDNDTWIFQVKSDEANNEKTVLDFSRIDSDFNILEGKLFGDAKQISERTLQFLQGNYGSDKSIIKYTYTNQDDEERTLVFIAPVATSQLLNGYFMMERGLFLVCMLLCVIGMVITALSISKRIRKSLVPFSRMLEDYGDTNVIDEDVQIPGELEPIKDNFIHLTERLEQANKHRLESEQEKNRMIADLSHDLKSPLTVIQGYAKALETGKVTGEDAAKYLRVIQKKSDTSVGMINNLMQYATMEHPDYKVHREKIDFCEFLRVCLVERYEELEEQGIELNLEIPEEPVMFDVDRRIMGSVMENMINNTIRYNESGTQIFVSLFSSDGQITVTYADTGIGIPEEIRKDVFKPFVIGNQARTSTKGTGIGMSIIRRGIEMHGGTIELLDPSGKTFSTIFEMRFPVRDEKEEDASENA